MHAQATWRALLYSGPVFFYCPHGSGVSGAGEDPEDGLAPAWDGRGEEWPSAKEQKGYHERDGHTGDIDSHEAPVALPVDRTRREGAKGPVVFGDPAEFLQHGPEARGVTIVTERPLSHSQGRKKVSEAVANCAWALLLQVSHQAGP